MKRFRYAVAALVLSVLVVFTSCDGGFPFGGKPSSSNGRNYSTFKKNVDNFDFPMNPNFTEMTDSEFKQFQRDMAEDPDSIGCTVDRYNGSFYYNESNMSMWQNPDGLWWGSVSMNGNMFVMQFTNDWPDKAWAALLPGKPDLKFVGWTIVEIAPDLHQWMGMFMNDGKHDIDSVVAEYVSRLERAGWSYKTDEYGEYFLKFIDGTYAEVSFSTIGAFHYIYVSVDGV